MYNPILAEWAPSVIAAVAAVEEKTESASEIVFAAAEIPTVSDEQISKDLLMPEATVFEPAEDFVVVTEAAAAITPEVSHLYWTTNFVK
ncbi:hypothetical protein KSP40_PGU003644 [Platanthera guangdongensis]|uniref:Uncharacterized protein n=1 Tax=Platanthera guangdongensis TaxID=2320717 RepID=A0ABR2ME10_9ASPA